MHFVPPEIQIPRSLASREKSSPIPPRSNNAPLGVGRRIFQNDSIFRLGRNGPFHGPKGRAKEKESCFFVRITNQGISRRA